MAGSRFALAACAVALAVLVAGAVRSEESAATDLVPIEVTVLQLSDQPGEADPRVERFERLLRGQIPYQSLAVIDTHRRELPLNELWTLRLPNERSLQLRPLDLDRGQGALLSLDVEESVQGDFRVRRGQPLVVGGPRYGDGKLVVVVDTE
jgi:hypothetical protein